MLKVLVEATGLVLGSFLVAIGLIAATWSIFVPIRHPDWGALAIILALIAAFTTHLLAGEFLSMVTILLLITTPIMWIEGRAWRGRNLEKS